MNIVPLTSNVDTLGKSSAQFGAVYALTVYGNGTELAKITRKLDDFGTPDDNTDLDATTSRHGLMSKLDKVKLDGIESGATADQTDAEIETAYNNRVAQVSSGEIATPTGTGIRRYSPANIAAIADVRIAASTTSYDDGDAVAAIAAAKADTDTVQAVESAGTLTWNVRRKSSGLSGGSEGALGSDSSGLFVALGNTSTTACAGNDSRLLSTDEKAAISAASSPAAGNPFTTVTGARAIKLDDFATPDDNTDLDATTGRHGLMPKADKVKLDAIEANATADQTDSEIETAYNNRVAQVSSGEIATPTGTGIRRFSPANIAAIADVRIAAAAPSSPAPPRVLMRHNAADGTAGGTATAGGWETRPLSFEALDTDNICSLSSNEFTIPAGTYDIEAMAQGYKVNGIQIRLWNVTAGALVETLVPVAGYSAAADAVASHAFLHGRFTIASSAIFRLEQKVGATQATNGMGIPGSLGTPEVYAAVSLTKVA